MCSLALLLDEDNLRLSASDFSPGSIRLAPRAARGPRFTRLQGSIAHTRVCGAPDMISILGVGNGSRMFAFVKNAAGYGPNPETVQPISAVLARHSSGGS